MAPAQKRKGARTPSPSLHSVLKKELSLRFDRTLTVGKLRLVIMREALQCEGICTPQTDEDYRRSDAPMTSDFYVRGFCGPSIIGENSIAISQTYRDDDGMLVERVCCLDCALKSGFVSKGPR